MNEVAELEARIGKIVLARIANVLKQNGDTTDQQMNNFLCCGAQLMTLLQQEEIVDRVGRHYRLTSIGRELL